MKNVILNAMISLSVLACFPGEGISQTEQLTHESGTNVNPATPEIRFRMPDPNQAEIEEQKVKDYRAQQAALRISPWITMSGRAVNQGNDVVDSEQQRIADIAFAHLNDLNMIVRDGLKVLVETTDNVGVVTIEAVVPEGHLGPAFLYKITIDKNTGEVTKLLLGG